MLSSDRTKDLVVAAALAGALGLVVARRLPRLLFDSASYTDGASVYEDTRADGVRYAVWDTPELLSSEVNTAARESRPSLSPDGRWLVFAVGEEGLGADLWLAELFEGEPRDARPLDGLNTPADELAPAFGLGRLYFASDREGGPGGYDLWFAEFEDGELGPARPVPGGLNTPANETDPAPGRSARGEALLAFASDRALEERGDYDLFLAHPERPRARPPGEVELQRLEALNSDADEREPAFSGDGRILYFATDRARADGGFELWRSLRDGASWLEPAAVRGLASPNSRRSPAPSADGFTLLFEEPGEAEDSAEPDGGRILRARSLELFQLPEPDLGWYDLILFGLLLLVALLALLAKRWHQLEVVYKCALISILLHILLMLLLRAVHPESGALLRGEERDGRTFRVRVLSDSSLASATRERSGALEALRSEPAVSAAPTRIETPALPALPADAPAQALELAAAGAAAAPARAASAAERAQASDPAPAPAVAAPSESFERLDAQARELALGAAAEVGELPAAEVRELAASEVAVRGAGDARARPSGFQAERPEAAVAAAPAQAESRAVRATPGVSPAAAAGVEGPSESFERLAESAPTLAPTGDAARFDRAESAPPEGAPDARAEVAALTPAGPSGESRPREAALALRGAGLPDADAPSAAEDVARARAARPTRGEGPELATPAERFERLAEAAPAAGPSLPDAAAFAGGAPATAGSSEPTRSDSVLAQARGPSRVGAPAPASVQLAGESLPAAPAARGAAFESSVATRDVVAGAPSLAAPSESFERLSAPAPVLSTSREASSFERGEAARLAEVQGTRAQLPSPSSGAASSAPAPADAALALRADALPASGAPAAASEVVRSLDPQVATGARTRLEAPRERFERLAEASPAGDPALPGAAAFESSAPSIESAGDPRRSPTSFEPVRGSAEVGAPVAIGFERPEAELSAAPRARSVALAGSPAARSSGAPAPALEAPSESFERLAADAEDDALAGVLRAAPAFEPAAADAGAELARSWQGADGLDRGAAGGAMSALAPLTLREGRAAEAPDTPAPSAVARSFEPSSSRTLALELPPERFVARAEPVAPEPEPSLPAASEFAPSRSPEAELAPRRWERAAREATAQLDEAPPRERFEVRPRQDERPLARAPERLDETPYRSRFGERKEIALEEHGGGADTERAVALGLAYLASVQNEDGSWGDPRRTHRKYRQVAVGKTGLSLLAFMGAGHTPGSGGEHEDTVESAIEFLLSVQGRRSGQFGNTNAYSHGIATYALAECFALTRDERLRAPLERAVATILRNQIRRGDRRLVGGWSYYYPDGEVYDGWPRVSVTAWQIMALESARLGGLEVPDEVFAAARSFLLRSWDGRLGAFRYSHDPERLNSEYSTLPGSTPAALFALGLLGDEVAGEAFADARGFVSRRAPSGYEWRGDDAFVERAACNLYFWYYGTLALFRIGGEEWQRWNTGLKETLLPSQAEDGSWEPLSVYADYAGDDEEDKSYTTAMCVLSLEVYYRYFTPLLEVR